MYGIGSEKQNGLLLIMTHRGIIMIYRVCKGFVGFN